MEVPERLSLHRRRVETLVTPLVPLGPWEEIASPRERLSKNLARWEAHAHSRLGALRDTFQMAVKPDAMSATDARLVLADPVSTLEVFRHSGAFRWSRRVEGEEDDEVPAVVPKDPTEVANAYLKARGLADARAEPGIVHFTEVTRRTSKGQISTYPIASHVDYLFRVRGVTVVGPGAKMRVTFGKDGEVAEVLKFFREPSPGVDDAPDRLEPRPVADRLAALGMRVVHDRSHVRKRLRSDASFGRLAGKKTVRVHEGMLGYYAAPPRLQQDALVPVIALGVSTRVPWEPRYQARRYLLACRLLSDDWNSVGHAIHALVRR